MSADAKSVLEAFKAFDEEATGTIDRADLKKTLQLVDPAVWTDQAAQEALAKFPGDSPVPYGDFVNDVFGAQAKTVDPKLAALRERLAALSTKAESDTGKADCSELSSLLKRIVTVPVPSAKDKKKDALAAQARKAFAYYDKDNSGFLDSEEIAALAKELGVAQEQDVVNRSFKDISQGRPTSFEEFEAWMTATGSSGASSALRAKLRGKDFTNALTKLSGMEQTLFKDQLAQLEDRAAQTLEGKSSVSIGVVDEPKFKISMNTQVHSLPAPAVETAEAKVEGESKQEETGEAEQQATSEAEDKSKAVWASMIGEVTLRYPGGELSDAQISLLQDFLDFVQDGAPEEFHQGKISRREDGAVILSGFGFKIPDEMPREVAEKLRSFGKAGFKHSVEWTSSLDFAALKNATEEEPYDITKDLRFASKISSSLVNGDLLNRIVVLQMVEMFFFPWGMPESEEQWPPPAQMFKAAMFEAFRVAQSAEATVEFASLQEIAESLNGLRDFAMPDSASFLQFTGGEDKPLSFFMPDLQRLTTKGIKHTIMKMASQSPKFRYDLSGMRRMRREKFPLFGGLTSLKAFLRIIEDCFVGVAFEFRSEDPEGGGKLRVDFELTGLTGISKLVPTFQEVAEMIDVVAKADDGECDAFNMWVAKN